MLAIATNIPVLLMTGFVLQGHICPFTRQYKVVLIHFLKYTCKSQHLKQLPEIQNVVYK